MTETSLLWDGDSVGDAGPYDQDSFSKIFSMVMSSSLSTEGVLVGKQNELVISNPTGLTIRVASGNAIVDGTFYDNTADVDLIASSPVSGYYYYTVVLKKNFVTQTIRITLSSPSAVSYPALVQTAGVTWEISLAQVRISHTGVVTLTDTRTFCKFASLVTPTNLDEKAFPYTTNGDQAYQSAADELSRLALGGAGAIQKSNGASPDWEALGTALQFLRVNTGATDIEWSSIFSALGDMLVGGAAGIPTVLGAPTIPGHVLGHSSGTLGWNGALTCGAVVSRSARQYGTGGEYLIFADERLDTHNFVDLVANDDRITIPSGLDGLYLILISVTFDYFITQDWDRGLSVRLGDGGGTVPDIIFGGGAKHQAIHGGSSGYDNEGTSFQCVGLMKLYENNYLRHYSWASNTENVGRSGALAIFRLMDIP